MAACNVALSSIIARSEIRSCRWAHTVYLPLSIVMCRGLSVISALSLVHFSYGPYHSTLELALAGRKTYVQLDYIKPYITKHHPS